MNMNQIGLIVEIFGFFFAVVFAGTFLDPKILGERIHRFTSEFNNGIAKLSEQYCPTWQTLAGNVIESILFLNPVESILLLIILLLKRAVGKDIIKKWIIIFGVVMVLVGLCLQLAGTYIT